MRNMSVPTIRKSDGTEEPFDVAKLEQSLEYAGVSSTARARIASRLLAEIKSGMSTDDIYRRAHEMLERDEEHPIAARYSLKRAIFELGPSGFPFERFFAEVLRSDGWRTQTGVTLRGRCAEHEVDILAERGNARVAIEAKFHNESAGKTDIKDALYVKARHEDLAAAHVGAITEGWLVTNTRFTHNAIRYARCSGLTLISWDYPEHRNLRTMVEDGKVHPITCLTTLTDTEKKHFLAKNIVLCKDAFTTHTLREEGVRPTHIPRVVEEARRLCGA
jgi:Holliday junction resolvase-like predicted endonuclease